MEKEFLSSLNKEDLVNIIIDLKQDVDQIKRHLYGEQKKPQKIKPKDLLYAMTDQKKRRKG